MNEKYIGLDVHQATKPRSGRESFGCDPVLREPHKTVLPGRIDGVSRDHSSLVDAKGVGNACARQVESGDPTRSITKETVNESGRVNIESRDRSSRADTCGGGTDRARRVERGHLTVRSAHEPVSAGVAVPSRDHSSPVDA